jgi:signal transduction histidine kinase
MKIQGPIARRLILSFAVLTVSAIAVATGAVVLWQHADRTIASLASLLFVVAVIVLAIALFTLQWIMRRVVAPLARLRIGVDEFRQGKLDNPIPVGGQDEIGELSSAFNTMAAELRQSQLEREEYARTLEQRVTERTAELSRRAMQLGINSLVTRQLSALLDLNELLAHVVNLIQEQFGYYFVGAWLMAEEKDGAVLRAGSGRVPGPKVGTRISLETDSLIARVCQSGTYRWVGDVRQSPDSLSPEPLPGVSSEVVLPLCVGDQTLGALDIQSEQADAFRVDDVAILQTLAEQIAIAINNAQLYRAEQARRQLAESLEQAGRELSSSLDLRRVPGRVLELLATVVPYERGAVLLAHGDVVRIIAQRGFPDAHKAIGLAVPIRPNDVYLQVVKANAPVIIDDVTHSPGWQQQDWLPINLSWMGVPLRAKDKVMGMISLTRRQASAFSGEDTQLAMAFVGQAAIALENARLYDELNRAYRTLKRMDKTKSDFINVAAHELRTPLTPIKGYAQMLQALPKVAGDTYSSSLVDGIVTSADRLQEIVNSMLDVSKIDSQTLEVVPEPLALATVIRRVQKEFGHTLSERNLTLTVSGLDDLPKVEADPDLMFKVFYHLVVNSIKYTPDGGAISVAGQVVSVNAKPMVEVVVGDTGVGIDPAHHRLIFEKFYQTGEVAFHSSGRTKFKGGGPGLGLAIARGIVLAHGGQIWVESDGYDETRCPGSRFYVRLPLKS